MESGPLSGRMAGRVFETFGSGYLGNWQLIRKGGTIVMDNRPIGVFDSGLGGLTVVRQLVRAMPGEDIVYFGDTGRVPYGTRSLETIEK